MVGRPGKTRLAAACSLVRAARLMAASGALLISGCASEPIEGTPADAATMEPADAVVAGPAAAAFAAEPTECPLQPQVSAAQTGRLALQLALELDGAPFGLGEITSDGLGGTVELSFLAYYLTNFRFLDAKGAAHPAVLLDADDAPLAYGLGLVNVDDPRTQQLRLAVTPGQYQALIFSVGVPAVCNALDPTTRGYPLSIETEMNWGWTMLNLRLEGSHLSSVDGNYALEYHLGLVDDYRTVQVPAAIDLRRAPLERTLAFELHQFLGIGQTTSERSYRELVDSLISPGTFLLR
jgi:hypothetical protein